MLGVDAEKNPCFDYINNAPSPLYTSFVNARKGNISSFMNTIYKSLRTIRIFISM